jgi:3-deoxy-D-manno-octulosonic-acid transferase
MTPWLIWRGTFFRRFFPRKIFPQNPYVWIHAVSVGEVIAAVPIVEAFRKQFPAWSYVVSTITDAGLESARKSMPYATSLLLPFDLSVCLKNVLQEPPSLVVLSEGDIWPVFLTEAKRAGAHVVVISGKISQKSFRRLRYFGKWLYSFVDLFCMQGKSFAERLYALGVPRNKIVITGNTKVDAKFTPISSEEKRVWLQRLGISEDIRLIVVASSHDPEEELVVQKLQPLLSDSIRLLVVPRHPRRFAEVFEKMRILEPLTVRLSDRGTLSWRVMVVDTMGVLLELYQLATVAIVCGSFVSKVGGHNIVEPAIARVPVVVGPYMQSQTILCESAKENGAIIQVGVDFLDETIKKLLEEPMYKNQLANAAQRWAEGLRGATERTMIAVKNEIDVIKNEKG